MRKISLALLFCVICATGMAQTDSLFMSRFRDAVVTTHELNGLCYIEDNRREAEDICGVIRIKESIAGNTLLAYIDTEISPLGACPDAKLERNYKPNTIKINGDQFKIGKEVADLVFVRFCPINLYHISATENQFIVIYGQFFAWTSSDAMRIPGKMYIMVMLDNDGRVLSHLNHVYYNKLSNRGLIRQVDQLFFLNE